VWGKTRLALWFPDVEGCGAIEGESFQPGEAWLFPEAGRQAAVHAETNARFLRTYVPR
jgi:hypothetical protein